MSWPLRAWTKTIQLPSGEIFGKAVAHAVVRGAGDGLGVAAFAVVERDAVEVVLDLGFVGIVGVGGQLAVRRDTDLRASARAKTRYLPSGLQTALVWTYCGSSAPGSGCSVCRSRGCTRQDAAGGIEDLKEAVVLEVE